MLPIVHVALITALGFGGGWLFYRIWRGLLPRGRSREFWELMSRNIRGMLESEETTDLLAHYRALIVAVGRYAGRNMIAVLAGIAPLAVAYSLFELIPFESVASSGRNPFAPHLSDAEFTLLLCATAGSAGAAWRGRKLQTATP